MQCSKKLNLADIFHLRKYPDKKIIDFIVSIESEYIQLVALRDLRHGFETFDSHSHQSCGHWMENHIDHDLDLINASEKENIENENCLYCDKKSLPNQKCYPPTWGAATAAYSICGCDCHFNEPEKEMNLKIYRNVKEEEKNNDIYLRLSEGIDGIYLIVCDKQGKRLPSGDLLKITQEGIVLESHIDDKFGFNLDENGKLKIID